MNRPITISLMTLPLFAVTAAEPLTLHTRTQVETAPGTNRFHSLIQTEEWDPAKTAIVICDMWNQHWCQGATAALPRWPHA